MTGSVYPSVIFLILMKEPSRTLNEGYTVFCSSPVPGRGKYYFMFYQPKELWQYESALFYCDKRQIKAYMLSQIAAGAKLKKQTFVTVDEVASAQMEELKAVYPVLNVEQAKMADFRFQKFIESVFEKKIVSSVFLMGEVRHSPGRCG